jgi:SurA N-terminal domain
MQEQNETNQTTYREVPTTSEEVASNVTTHVPPVTTHTARFGAAKRYALVGVIVLIMGIGLLYTLERQGRVATGFFGDVSENVAAAIVNGEKISKRDLDSSVSQMLQMAEAQGTNTADADVQAQYRTDAMETLINGELLRQAAINEGMKASNEAIDARLEEIEMGAGGKEALAAKMEEFGISEAVLRRDIENEILITALFDAKFPTDDMVVDEAEIKEVYEQAGGEEAGLPPIEEVSDQVAEQVKVNRQQTMVSEYIAQLREAAEIELR